jgi:DNA-directed RNA polymerase specialized sigma24 family protein
VPAILARLKENFAMPSPKKKSDASERRGKDVSTTAWTRVEQAAHDPALLAELLEKYRLALWSYLVHTKRLSETEADDVLQEFLTARILEGNLLSLADRTRGKFRGLLLTALERFLIDHWRKQASRKAAPDRAGGLDVEFDLAAPNQDVDAAFETGWAFSVFAEAMARLEKECRTSDRGDLWETFQARAGRIIQGLEPLPYAALVPQCGRDEKQVANLWGTAQVKFQRILKQVLVDFGAEDADLELGDLKSAMRGSSGELIERLRLRLWSELPRLSDPSAADHPVDLDALVGIWDAGEEPASGEDCWQRLLQHVIAPPSAEEPSEAIGDVLNSAAPPAALLERIKDFAKDVRGSAGDKQTVEAATTLYYVSIAVAFVKANVSITDQDGPTLVNGFAWTLSRPWLDGVSRAIVEEVRSAEEMT